jgi:glucokinase
MKLLPVVLGVDIGGTKVAAGLVTPGGKIVFKTRQPMQTSGTDQQAMGAVHSVIRSCMEAAEGPVSSIGVVSPGPLDIATGVVLNPPNLPCWVNFPLAENIRREYGLRTLVDNDANAAGLAEAIWGAAAGYNSVFYATVGTGIGTAIVFDRKLYYGRTGMAAEGGHNTIDRRGAVVCGCGKPGCVEGLAAGPGIARRMRDRVGAGERSSALQLAGGSLAAITAHEVVQAWREGDKLAKEIVTDTMDVLTVWFGNVIDLLEPEVIVVGGGLGSLVSEWFGYIREGLPRWSINPRCQQVPLMPAKFGVDAGIVGAAALCCSEPAAIGVASLASSD